MRHKFPRAFPPGWIATLFLFTTLTGLCGQTNQVKFEVQLIWATNDKQSPNPKHKAVEPEIRKKLSELPLKWENYFEVNRKEFSVVKDGKTKEPLSEKCSIVVKDVEGKKVEVSLYGKTGDAVLAQTQPLSKGEILVLGGNAPDKTAWLVTLKRLK